MDNRLDSPSSIREAVTQLAALPRGRERTAGFVRLLTSPRPYRAVVEMIDQRVLPDLLPDLAACRGVAQPVRHHVHDVFDHQVAAVREMERVLDGDAGLEVDHRMEHYLDQPVGDGLTRRQLMGLIALLHDVGKPDTRSLRPDGQPQFLGHQDTGADITSRILHDLGLGPEVAGFVTEAVRHHMRPFSLADPNGRVSDRAARRFMRRTGEAARAVLLLHLADVRAARGDTLVAEQYEEHLSLVTRLLADVDREQQTATAAPLLSGLDVLALGVPQGPEVGRVLREVEAARSTGLVSTREQALDLARTLA